MGAYEDLMRIDEEVSEFDAEVSEFDEDCEVEVTFHGESGKTGPDWSDSSREEEREDDEEGIMNVDEP